MISLVGITKTYPLPGNGRLELLRGIDLTLERGEVVAVVGRSGSGKTTLLNVLGLLDRFDAGEYRIEGHDASSLSDVEASRIRGKTFGFVFQHFHLLDRRTALQNVVAPLQHGTWTDLRQSRERAARLLDEVGLADRLWAKPSQLSGGEQQRVAIARALVRQPAWILADEPTGSLDLQTAHPVLSLLAETSRRRGCGLVMVTHDPSVARIADRRLALESGQLVPQ